MNFTFVLDESKVNTIARAMQRSLDAFTQDRAETLALQADLQDQLNKQLPEQQPPVVTPRPAEPAAQSETESVKD